MFPGETLKKQLSPALIGNHPELDDSEFVSEEEKANTCIWLVQHITISTLLS